MSSKTIYRYLTTQQKDDQFRFYVYAYIRASDSATAKAGTPYYIGKGCGKRAWERTRRGTASTPKDVSMIRILECNLSEVGALAVEARMIRWWGRKIDGSGVLNNISVGGEGNSGNVPVIDKNGNIFSIPTTDARIIAGEVVYVVSGRKQTEDTIKKRTSHFIGKANAKTISGEKLGKVDLSDPRWGTGEIIGVNTGNTQTDAEKENISKRNTGKRGAYLPSGECIGQVDVSDPRFSTGEIIGIHHDGMVVCTDATGKTFRASAKSEEYLSGKIWHISKGVVNDKVGASRLKMSIEDYMEFKNRVVEYASSNEVTASECSAKFGIGRETISKMLADSGKSYILTSQEMIMLSKLRKLGISSYLETKNEIRNMVVTGVSMETITEKFGIGILAIKTMLK